MGHGHHHPHHHHHHSTDGQKNLLLAFFLNFTFAIIEIFGGIYTNSVAILSDAIHDFGDSMALLFSYFLEKYSNKDADKVYTYGYRRFSVLAAVINSLILLIGAIFIIKESVERLMAPEPINPQGALAFALLGICVNGFAAYRLSKGEGINQKVAMYHLLEDIFGWVAVLIVSIVLMFKPWYILDAILSIVISLVILKGVYNSFKMGVTIFLQRFPDNINMKELVEELKSIDDVCDVHFVQGWSLDGSEHAITCHIAVPPEYTMSQLEPLKAKIKDHLKEKGIYNSALEFESSEVACEDL